MAAGRARAVVILPGVMVDRHSARAGSAAVLPMLIGVVPFGLIAGAAPVSEGLGGGLAGVLSVAIFAGASQLAAIDVLASDGSVITTAVVVWTINLRLLLYSASIAPLMARHSLPRRLGLAYFLTDQAYAVTITRFSAPTDDGAETSYYLGAGLTLWSAWQVATWTGVVVGAAIPDDVPLEFAIPLVFLVLLIPTLTTRPAVAAAVVGGLSAVAAGHFGAGPLSVLIGAIVGTAVDYRVGDEAAASEASP